MVIARFFFLFRGRYERLVDFQGRWKIDEFHNLESYPFFSIVNRVDKSIVVYIGGYLQYRIVPYLYDNTLWKSHFLWIVWKIIDTGQDNHLDPYNNDNNCAFQYFTSKNAYALILCLTNRSTNIITLNSIHCKGLSSFIHRFSCRKLSFAL